MNEFKTGIWNFFEKKQVGELEGHKGFILQIVTVNKKYIAACLTDRSIRIWNLKERRQYTIFGGHAAAINCISLAPDQWYLISTSQDSTIRVWNCLTKSQEYGLEVQISNITSIALTRSYNYATSDLKIEEFIN